MSEIVPLWKSHYSSGKSILTLEKAGASKSNEPDSIIDLCLKNNIKDVYLVEDNFSSFLEAAVNCKDAELNLIYGIRIPICVNMEDKTEYSFMNTSKYVIFIRSEEGYKKLIKLYSIANKIGFYYKPRLDFKALNDHWDDKHLLMTIPFYDSFLHHNHLNGGLCAPEFRQIKPTFFIEDNDHPFDDILQNRVFEYASKNQYKVCRAKTILYAKRKDFTEYLTHRCLTGRSFSGNRTLSNPGIDHLCSYEFCLESYLEKR